jgi:hypothetical protein
VVDEGRPHLLAVDDVVVAVAHGRRRQAGEVGAGTRLAVADREVQVPRQDLRQEERLLLVAAERHDRRADRVRGEERDRHGGALGLVEEDVLVEQVRPCPPYSSGHDSPSQPSLPS